MMNSMTKMMNSMTPEKRIVRNWSRRLDCVMLASIFPSSFAWTLSIYPSSFASILAPNWYIMTVVMPPTAVTAIVAMLVPGPRTYAYILHI